MKNRSGFTLIELMIVVVILAILSAVIMPRFAGRTQQARISAAKTDIGNISMVLDMYELDNGQYPTTDQGLAALYTKPGGSPVPTNWNGPYLKKKAVDPWGNPYKYACPGTHGNDFDLSSMGPDGVAGSQDDINNWEVTQSAD